MHLKPEAVDQLAFQALQRWEDRRHIEGFVQAPSLEILFEHLDSLAEYNRPESPRSDGRTAVLSARQAIVPRRDICLIATARNEGLYVLEWIAYHKSIGINNITIYTNNNNDGSNDLLSRLAEHGVIRLLINRVENGINAQRKAYGHALYADPYVLDYEWALIIDLDEFLILDPRFATVQEILAWHGGACDAIVFNWLYFGSGGRKGWSDDLVLRRCNHPIEFNRHIKSMFRPRLMMHSTPHFPVRADDEQHSTRHADRSEYQPHPSALGRSGSAAIVQGSAWVGHFFYKSAEEFASKFSKNRGDEPTIETLSLTSLTSQFVRAFWKQLKQERLASFAISPQIVAATEARVMSLKDLPDVARAYEAVVASYEERLALIRREIVTCEGVTQAGEHGQAFLRRLGIKPTV